MAEHLTPNIVRIKEIQDVTGFSLSYLRRLTREGKLVGERIGREYVYLTSDVNRLFGTKFPVRNVTKVSRISNL